ncbi:MAG: DUF3368 domain-containing protein [Promethearchaeota archaeon]
MNVVSNASPLIFISKLGLLELLEIFTTIFIPPEVHEEILKGKKEAYEEAVGIEALIEQGRIQVLEASTTLPVLEEFPIHRGEKAVIQLALDEKVTKVLIDERKARITASLLGLDSRGTIWILMENYRQAIISKAEVKKLFLDLIQKGYHISSSLMAETLKQLDEL